MSRQRYGFRAGHQGLSEQKRRLRQKARHLIDSKDPQIISIGDRVIRAVASEPDPEYSALHLMCAGLDAAQETTKPWITCMLHIMSKFPDAQS